MTPIPRIDLRLLRQFVAVAEELHFRRAAERLGMSQPPLTSAIRQLEAEVGATLVERGRKTVRLTPAGTVLLNEARQLLASASYALSATRDAAAGKLGRVRLGYVGSAMHGRLPGAIRLFRRSHPQVRLELREMTTSAQIGALRDGTLDMGVVIPPISDAGGLTLTAFDADRLVIVLPAGHRFASGQAPHLVDLASEPFVSWPRSQGSGFHDRAISLCAAAGFAPEIVQEAHGMHAVLSLVAAEVGVALVPESMARTRVDEVVMRPIDGEDAGFDLCLCFASDPAPTVREFVEAFAR